MASAPASGTGYCVWEYQDGTWTVVESHCEGTHKCALSSGSEKTGATNDEFLAAVEVKIGMPTRAFMSKMKLANGTRYTMDCA